MSDIRSALEDAFDSGSESTETEAVVDHAQDTTDVVERETPSDEPQARARDEQGRFASKATEALLLCSVLPSALMLWSLLGFHRIRRVFRLASLLEGTTFMHHTYTLNLLAFIQIVRSA